GFREREDTAVADRPNGTPFIARAWRLRAVFDDFQLARACESNQRVHIGWMSEEVHRDDGPSKVRDGCGRGLWIEGKGAVIDVRENWYGVVHQYGGRCCRERIRRHDHLLAWLDSNGDDRRMERRSRRIERDGKTSVVV